jgi:Ca2+-transporting ATPase
MLEMSVSLAVAAVPEALPAMTTLILALGVLEMARRHAIVRRLSAVEALGSTTVICADKTGTLTENRMTVSEAALPGGKVSPIHDGQRALGDILLTGVLCNEAESSNVGDPTEAALLMAAENAGIDISAVRAEFAKEFEEPFDPMTKRMITVHSCDGGSTAYLKGGPSAVLELASFYKRCDGTVAPLGEKEREEIISTNEGMAARGLRVLAFGMKETRRPPEEIDLTGDFTFLGFLGMTDPPRKGVSEALQAAARAGIRVVMLTGDQLSTARAVARELGLGRNGDIFAMHSRELSSEAALAHAAQKAHVFARVSPEDKLRIVEALQAAGETVAVTGDGINDAPALKKANIGVAMGGRGTEVAKEAADIVLTDDDLSTIVRAIEGGRRIHANIIKFVHLLFSHNFGEVLFIFAAMTAGLPLPLMPLQILWMNLVTDIFPALALAVEPAEPGLMLQPPRRESHFLSKSFAGLIAWQGALLATLSLAAYLWALSVYGEGPHARMVALFTLVSGQIGQTFNCRSRRTSAFSRLQHSPNLFLAIGAVILLQIAAVCLAPLATVLDLPSPNRTDLLAFLVCAVVPIAVTEIYKKFSALRMNACVCAP